MHSSIYHGKSILLTMLSKSLQTKINSQLCRSSLRLVNSKLMGYSQMISWFWRNSSTHKEVYQISVWQIARYGCLQRSWSAHFFGDDEKIIPPTWNNLYKTTMKLMGCPLVIGPDPSLYVDLGMAMNITNLYRTRFTTSHWHNLAFRLYQYSRLETSKVYHIVSMDFPKIVWLPSRVWGMSEVFLLRSFGSTA